MTQFFRSISCQLFSINCDSPGRCEPLDIERESDPKIVRLESATIGQVARISCRVSVVGWNAKAMVFVRSAVPPVVRVGMVAERLKC